MDIDFMTAVYCFLGGVSVAFLLAGVQRFCFPHTILKQETVESEEEKNLD